MRSSRGALAVRGGLGCVLGCVLVGVMAGASACARPGTGTTNAAPVAEASAAPSPSPSPPDPSVALAGAITKTRATPLTFSIDTAIGGVAAMHGTGAVDPADHRQSMTMTVTADHKTEHARAIVIGTDLYLKTDEPPPGVSRKKWMHVDISKLAGLSSTGLGDLSDPSGLESYAKAVATVHLTGPGQYEGTLDFSKLAAASIAESFGPIGGDAIKAVPFTATTDEQDRLTSIVIKMPSIGAGMPATTLTARFSDFGGPVTIQAPPAAQIQEAPKNLFPSFGT